MSPDHPEAGDPSALIRSAERLRASASHQRMRAMELLDRLGDRNGSPDSATP